MIRKSLIMLLISQFCFASNIMNIEGQSEKELEVTEQSKFAKNRYDYNYFSFDIKRSANVGVDLTQSILGFHKFLGDISYNSPVPKLTAGAVGFRSLELVFEDYIARLLMIGNHEVFGHGGRMREFDYTIERYYVHPLGLGGATYFDGDPDIHIHKKSATRFGGTEANSRLAKSLATKFYMTGKIDYRDAGLFLHANSDITQYIMLTSAMDYGKDSLLNGNDILSYTASVNAWHGGEHLEIGKLKKLAFLNFANTFTINSFISQVSYIAAGVKTSDRLCIGSQDLAGFTRLSFAPYGPEVGVDVYFKDKKGKSYNVLVKHGSTAGMHSYCLDVSALDFIEANDYEVGVRGVTWYQPKLFSIREKEEYSVGVGAYLDVFYKISNLLNTKFTFGIKTRGYIEAEPLSSSAIFRFGIGI